MVMTETGQAQIEAAAEHYRGPQDALRGGRQAPSRDNEGRLRARLDGMGEQISTARRQLEKALDVLHARIAPVLNPAETASGLASGASRDGNDRIGESPFGEQLDVMRADLNSLIEEIERIHALADRIEV